MRNTHYRKRIMTVAAMAAASLAVSACSSSPPAVVGAVSPQTSAALGQQTYSAVPMTTYPLRASDVISVTVFREAELSAEALTIGVDGTVGLPLLGSVEVAGLTASQVASRIETQLGSRYLRDPSVAVNIVSYGSHRVTVDGEVERPGMFEFLPGTRLSGGISMAEGPTRVAQIREVAVFRETPDGMAVAKFDFRQVRAGTMLDPVLQPGDRIVVGTNGLSQFWQDLLTALPAFALFTRI